VHQSQNIYIYSPERKQDKKPASPPTKRNRAVNELFAALVVPDGARVVVSSLTGGSVGGDAKAGATVAGSAPLPFIVVETGEAGVVTGTFVAPTGMLVGTGTKEPKLKPAIDIKSE